MIEGPIETPLIRYAGPAHGWSEIWLKDETRQVTGAFKYRGASAALARIDPPGLIVSATTGNHGLGLAYAARERGLDAVLVMPRHVREYKRRKLRDAGAEIEIVGSTYSESEIRARELADRMGGVFVSSFDAEDVIAGHRTLFGEVDRAGLRPDVAIVPVGGGGLIAAALSSWGGAVAIEGVESEASRGMARSLAAGRRVCVAGEGSFAEGLLVPVVGRLGFEACRRARPRLHAVSDAALRDAMRALRKHHGILAEGAGAAALAAVLGSGRPGRCLCIISGGNVDLTDDARLMAEQPLIGLGP